MSLQGRRSGCGNLSSTWFGAAIFSLLRPFTGKSINHISPFRPVIPANKFNDYRTARFLDLCTLGRIKINHPYFASFGLPANTQ
jgi:hypothetical protein